MSEHKPYLIIGDGQVGSALMDKLGEQAVQSRRDTLDLSKAAASDYLELLHQYQPSVVINAAAYTQVDKAEEERELAMQIHATAPGLLAEACAARDILLVHYSTDYVFDGTGQKPWLEGDVANPVNYYGETKLAGEQAIQQAGGKHLIFRISWVYAQQGANFVNTMLKLGAKRESLNIVADQTGAPCYAEDIAKATIEVVTSFQQCRSLSQRTLGSSSNTANCEEILASAGMTDLSGVYHMCSSGETTWYDFALEIFDHANRYQPMLIRNIKAVPTSEYPTPAKRPHNSRMNCDRLKHTFDISLPHWKGSLLRYMEKKYAN